MEAHLYTISNHSWKEEEEKEEEEEEKVKEEEERGKLAPMFNMWIRP